MLAFFPNVGCENLFFPGIDPLHKIFIYIYIFIILLHINMCFIALEKKPMASD